MALQQLSPELKNKMDQIVRQREGNQTMKERLEVSGQAHRNEGLPDDSVRCRKLAKRIKSSGVTS